MLTRPALPVACAAVLLLSATSAPADDNPAPEPFKSAGLVQSGNFLLCPAEVELARRLEGLRELERRYHQRRREFNDLVARSIKYRRQLKDTRAALQENLTRLGGSTLGGAQRLQLESQNRQLVERIQELQREIDKRLNAVDEASPLTRAAIEHVNARTALAVSLLACRRFIDESRDCYRRILEDDALKRAAQQLPDVALGPALRFDHIERRRLARIEPLVFSDGVPVYRRGGLYRVSLIIGEQTPAAFTYTGATGPTVVPLSLLQSAGLTITSDKREEIELEDRKVRAARTILPSLRVGSVVVSNVKAFVLSPEDADIGARLSAEAFGRYQAQLDTDRLRLEVVSPE